MSPKRQLKALMMFDSRSSSASGRCPPPEVGIVEEIEHKDVVLLWMRPVESRKGLHRLDAGEDLVHVHGVQQGLVVAGLELVGADQEAVGVLLELRGDPGGGKAVQRRFADLLPAELMFTRESDEGPVAALALPQVIADLAVELLLPLPAECRRTGRDHGRRAGCRGAARRWYRA